MSTGKLSSGRLELLLKSTEFYILLLLRRVADIAYVSGLQCWYRVEFRVRSVCLSVGYNRKL